MPRWEIEEKFCRSELVLMAWRSQEQNQYFKERMKESESGKKRNKGHNTYDGDIVPEGLPDEFYAAQDIYDKRGRLIAHKGDIYLGQVKGEDARRYMQSIGIPLPDGISKISITDERIKEAYGNKGPGRR